ncbi:winged helix-turn-helix transcriptional regulator [Noviherbaspirillum saxi]|uniref:Transcriptional regulator n=1 Tax=Noviherbaspirillum saxi TaxID=2320863 RepID=A0A3A3FGL7_9BURK|nr:helix-turn-helix domain-containing protein [Noviherbaspirillum saxi]RJF92320.1 transcriptional regulator [Noviherbaspirillum saxi]
MDESYGQFCTVARGAEALCERWTPLVVRELLLGSRRFNDLHRGVPRMSTSLLSQRLRHLEEIGVIRRTAVGKVWEYSLTEAGDELRPIIMALGTWGARWMGSRLRDNELDASLLMWDIRRSVRIAEFPPRPVVIQFLFHDARTGEKMWWLIVDNGTADLCRDDPGRDPILIVRSSVRALTEVWMGDRTPKEVLQARELRVEGPSHDAEDLWRWLGTGTFAAIRATATANRAPYDTA